VHSAAPLTEKRPVAHEVQAVEPAEPEYWPDTHEVHTLEPADEILPAVQDVQLVASEEPVVAT